MKYISFEEADPILNWTDTADALAAGHTLQKAKIGDLLLANEDRSLLNRGAWIDGVGLALKSVTVYPDNPSKTPPKPSVQGAMLLFDDVDGSLKAILDGPLVTKWKTAGDSVLGARLLANKTARSLLVVGAGTVAKNLFQAYREIFPDLSKFTVWNRNKNKAVQLADELSSIGINITVADDLEGAVKEAHIISCATMAKEPIIKGAWVANGTHVDLIGAYRPDMREADDELMKRGSIFVDARETTIGEIGELMIPMAAGVIKESDIIADLHDLCHGKAGRQTEDEITVFKNGGGAHLDLMTGKMIVDKILGSK